MRIGKMWTSSEYKLLARGLSDKEIAEKTGRTENAVYKKRRRLNDEGWDVPEGQFARIPPGASLSSIEKIQRINSLAKKYGIRLIPERRKI